MRSVWDRYVARCGSPFACVLSQCKRLTILRYCEHVGVNADQYLLEGGPSDFEAWIDWMNRTTKKKSHETISQYWRWLCQAYSVLAKQPMDCFTTEQVRRVRRVPFDQPTIDDTLEADSCSLVP